MNICMYIFDLLIFYILFLEKHILFFVVSRKETSEKKINVASGLNRKKIKTKTPTSFR